jgi:hypothetical protein
MDKFKSAITGHLDIFIAENEDDFNGEKENWKEVLIHGDPEGLRSFAAYLIRLADMDQNSIEGLPVGAREHKHLRAGFELSLSSNDVIVGRLDAKATGHFYDRYIPKEK